MFYANKMTLIRPRGKLGVFISLTIRFFLKTHKTLVFFLQRKTFYGFFYPLNDINSLPPFEVKHQPKNAKQHILFFSNVLFKF